MKKLIMNKNLIVCFGTCSYYPANIYRGVIIPGTLLSEKNIMNKIKFLSSTNFARDKSFYYLPALNMTMVCILKDTHFPLLLVLSDLVNRLLSKIHKITLV